MPGRDPPFLRHLAPTCRLLLQDVTVTVRAGAHILSRASGRIRAGTLSALLGPSGAGKTTLLGARQAQASLLARASGTLCPQVTAPLLSGNRSHGVGQRAALLQMCWRGAARRGCRDRFGSGGSRWDRLSGGGSWRTSSRKVSCGAWLIHGGPCSALVGLMVACGLGSLGCTLLIGPSACRACRRACAKPNSPGAAAVRERAAQPARHARRPGAGVG